MTMTYPFTEAELAAAFDEWGCNCGPSALAFAIQRRLSEVRHIIPGFDEKRYTSPSMMKAALLVRGQAFRDVRPPSRASMFQPSPTLVRIQWTGPWTQPGANPKWAYRQTHWIATWMVKRNPPKPVDGGLPASDALVDLLACMVFDVNGGAMGFLRWQKEIVPLLVASYPRADGGWEPTHIWSLTKERTP